MFDPFSSYRLITSPYGDAFPGPAWSMADGDGPGTRGGTGAGLGVSVLLPPADAAVPAGPEAGTQHFGGYNRTGRSWQNPDAEVREVLKHGDDLTRRFGTRIYWAMALTDSKVAANMETLIDDTLADDITLKVAVDPPRPSEDDPDPEAKLAQTVLEEDQDSLDRLRPHLDDVLRPVLESMWVEFDGAVEPLWEATGAGQKVSYRLKRLATLPREAWEFVVDRFRNVDGYAGLDPDGKTVVVGPAGLAVMSWRPRAGYPGGRALLRSAHADWDMKMRLADPYFQHVRNFSDPFRVGKASSDPKAKRPRISTQDPPAPTGHPDPRHIYPAESMHHVLAHAGAAGYVVVGVDESIETQYPQGGGEAYINAFKLCGDNITEAIVGDIRATQGAEYGTYASAQVGRRNLGVRVSAGRRIVCRFIEGILRTQNEMNHGPEVAARLTPFVLFRNPEEETKASDWPGWEPTENQKAEIDGRLKLTPREVGKEQSLKDLDTQADIASKWVNDVGAPPLWAAKQAGLTEEELVELEEALAQRQEAERQMVQDQPAGDGPGQPGQTGTTDQDNLSGVADGQPLAAAADATTSTLNEP
jgi:hypothetical protein